MTSFKHLLVPVDFGDAMQPGIDLAVGLARVFDARITLVSALDISPFVATTPFAPAIDLEPIVASSERELKSVLARVKDQWPKTDATFRRGSPYEAILDVARAEGCDLIVIGTHGRRGIARVLLGSVAERIVRLSPVPVLTVHPAPHVEKAASTA